MGVPKSLGTLGAIIIMHCVSSVSLHAQFVNSGQAAPPAAGAVAGVTGQSYGEIRAGGPGFPVPGANAAVAGANSHAWAANSVLLPVGNIVGLSGNASANADQPDPKSSAAANSAAVIAYQASAPGTFDLNLRAFMSTNYHANAHASWNVEIYDAAQLGYAYIGTNATNFPPGCEAVTVFAGYEACINFVQAAPLPFPYETVQLAAVVGSGGNNCRYEHTVGNIAVGDCTITSNGLAMLSNGVDGPDTFKFTTSSTYFVVALNASASAGPSDCLYYYKGCQQYDESQPLGTAYVVVDPVIVPDPVNPDIVITSTSGPNPNPDNPLIPSNILASLDPEKLSALAKWGITPNSQALPPTTIAAVSQLSNPAGWNNTNVTVALNATDAGGPGIKAITFALSGAETGGATVPGASTSVTISAEGVTTLTYFAQDTAGGQEAPKTLVVRIDKTPPTITTTRTPLANSNGWNNMNVAVSFQCSDSLSGLAAGSPPATTLLSAEGANQSVTGTCQDLAGNSASATVNGINIDKTPPVVTASANPSTLWPPNGKMVDVIVSGTMTDNLSGVNPSGATVAVMDSYGLVQPSGGINMAPDGTYSVVVSLEARRNGQDKNGRLYAITVSAQDKAGNAASSVTTVLVPHDQGQ